MFDARRGVAGFAFIASVDQHVQILIQELACRFVADIIRCAGNEYVFHRASSSLRLAVLLLDLTLAIRSGLQLPQWGAQILREGAKHDIEADAYPLCLAVIRVDGVLQIERQDQQRSGGDVYHHLIGVLARQRRHRRLTPGRRPKHDRAHVVGRDHGSGISAAFGTT